MTDASGFVCLTIQADNPFGWPQYFGVTTKVNPVNAANFDLSWSTILRRAKGVAPPVVLESFTHLSFQPADPNYAATQINQLSKLIHVPSSYTPPAANPSGYPAAPTMLSNPGTVTAGYQ